MDMEDVYISSFLTLSLSLSVCLSPTICSSSCEEYHTDAYLAADEGKKYRPGI